MIRIQSFMFNPFQENTYVVYNDKNDCMIVDPGCYDRREREILRDFIESNGLKPLLLINTHCHIDHVFGNSFAETEYGLRLRIHEAELPVLGAVDKVASMYGLNYTPGGTPEIINGETIEFGSEVFEILFVPGHAPGHIAIYHKESGSLLSGDVLFRESIGRTDLPGGDALTLSKSIKNVLYTLPDETKVYPGHMGITTIGHEKKHNPFVKA